MNMINSLILECAVLGEVSDTGLFKVVSERQEKVGEDWTKTSVTVLCQVPEVMLDSVKKFATDGRGLRIVGRLQLLYGGIVGVFVEHIEYKNFPNSIREGKYNFMQD